MDIKGKVQNIAKNRDFYIFNIVTKDGGRKVLSAKEIPEIQKGTRVSFTDLVEEKGMFGRKKFIVKEDTLIALFPSIYLEPQEVDLANICRYIPFLSEFFSEKVEVHHKEMDFYNSIRGYEIENEKVRDLVERFPKDIKSKFSYKNFELSSKFGVLLYDTLYFGRVPAVFKGNEMKAKFQSIASKSDKFIIIDEDSGKLNEFDINIIEKKNLLDLRNNIALSVNSPSHKELLEYNCSDLCPLLNYCKRVFESQESFDIFEKKFNEFLRNEMKNRRAWVKQLREGNHPRRGSVEIYAVENKPLSINAKISNNEAFLKKGEEVLVIERPPLDRITFGNVQKIGYDKILLSTETGTVNPELVAPSVKRSEMHRGFFELLYSGNPLKGLFIEKKIVEAIPYSIESYFEDEDQNKAISLILSENPIATIRGEGGSGKKFVVKESLKRMEGEVRIAILTDSRKDEFESYFKEFEFVKVFRIEENEYYLSPRVYDCTFLFLLKPLGEEMILEIAGRCNKLVILTNNTEQKYSFEENIPESLKISLKTSHRFGRHILHFISPLLFSPMTEKDDVLFTVPNMDVVDGKFADLVNPEKFVQFVEVKGHTSGKKNRWNLEEGNLTVDIITEFIKGGVGRDTIEVVVPYERQKALVEQIFETRNMEPASIFEVEDSHERDIVILNLVDTKDVRSSLKDNHMLSFALSRATSKLIIIGDKNIVKISESFSKLFKK